LDNEVGVEVGWDCNNISQQDYFEVTNSTYVWKVTYDWSRATNGCADAERGNLALNGMKSEK